MVNADKTAPSKPIPAKIGAFAINNSDEQMLEPGEQIVTVVHRHPIGIIGIYAEMLFGIVALAVLVFLVSDGFFNQVSGQDLILVGSAAVFIGIFLVVMLVIATYIYRRSRLIVTDKSLVQVIQRALFNKKVSRLSMSNVEDVNVEQKGIMATVLGYGTLTIQTAGQIDNFIFPLCPSPDKYAERILEARQKYAKAHEDQKD